MRLLAAIIYVPGGDRARYQVLGKGTCLLWGAVVGALVKPVRFALFTPLRMIA